MLLRPMLNDLWNLLNNLLKQQLLNVRRNCLKLQRFAQKFHTSLQVHLQRLFSLFGLSNVFFRLNQMDTHFHMAVLTNICIHTLKLIWKVDGKLKRVLLNAWLTFGLRLLQLTKYVVKHIPSHLQVVRFIKTLRLVVKHVIRKMPSIHCLIWCWSQLLKLTFLNQT